MGTQPMETNSARRRGHIGRAAYRVHCLFRIEVFELVQGDFPDIRPSDVKVLSYLPEAGASVSALAMRAEMSRQGMSKMVASLVERGYLARRADPNDARALMVTMTDRGLKLLETSLTAIEALEAKWEAEVGTDAMEQAKKTLLHIANTFGGDDYM